MLAALWGGSFLFMRMGAPEFGPVVLITLRTATAALFLLPLVVWSKQWNSIIQNFRLLLLVGVLGTAIPFTLLSYAVLTVTAGYASIINATAPIFTAIIAWVWVKEKLSTVAIGGLIIGFCGVVVLTFDKQGNSSSINILPVLAGLSATFGYGIGANVTRQKLAHVRPLTLACGSQFAATIFMLPFSFWFWPSQLPSFQAWVSVILLGVACTAIALIIYFRLIANIGVNKAMTVTYLIPFFGVIWGMIFLQESISLLMFMGGVLILIGVGLSSEILAKKR